MKPKNITWQQKKYHEKFGDPLTRTEKFCSICKVKKPLDQFYKNKKVKDGRCSTCKECSNEYAKYMNKMSMGKYND